jgi:hypothetical protein
MGHFFISYSRKDSDFVNRLVNDLLDIGQEVWLDTRSIPLGSTWEDEIKKGIEEADSILVICSPDSAKSDYVRQEIALARAAAKPFILILYRGAYGDMPTQWGLGAWEGHDFSGKYDPAWHKFEKRLFPDGPPVSLQALLAEGKATFGDSSQRWAAAEHDGNLSFIPLARGAYGLTAYLVGPSDDLLTPPDEIQVALQFTGANDKQFVREVAAYLQAIKQRIYMVYVQGPQDQNGAFSLPPSPKDAEILQASELQQASELVWRASVDFAWTAIRRSRRVNTSLAFFMAGPVALGIGLGAHEKHKMRVDVYSQMRNQKGDKAYLRVYRLDPQ